METTGIRDLKRHLSDYVRKAREGETILITARGREVAELRPVSPERSAVHALVDQGGVSWNGGKPKGLRGITVAGKPVAEVILEDRR